MRIKLSSDAITLKEKDEPALELNVLIIAHKQSQLASAAAFLSRRGVHCIVKSNIKDGIQYITAQKATLVFLSWNLPNSNIIKTHQLLIQNFKVECVVFAEKSDGKTAAELAGSRIPEVMQAPVSGPGLYMRIQKLIRAKDEQGKIDKLPGPKTNNSQDSNQNDKIVLRSSRNENSNDDTFVNLGSNHNKSGLINFQSQNTKHSEEDHESGSDDPNANDISAYMGQLTDELPVNNSTLQTEKKSSSPAIYTQKGFKTNSMKSQQDGLNGESHSTTEKGLQRGEMYESEIEETQSEEKKARSHKKEADYGSVMNVAKKQTPPKSFWKNQYTETKPTESAIPDYEKTKAKEALIIDFKPRSGSKNSESLLAQKTFEAIEKSVRPAYEDYVPVEVISKAKIFNIHTPKFKGYLIFVVPMFNELERNVVGSIRANLEKLLKEQNEPLLYFEELNVDLEQTDFLGWAQENAEFFVQTVDHKTEIICAYYPYNPAMPKVAEMSNKMATINIKDLKQDTKTSFNLYIHLPKNNKFVCYMKPGDIVTEKHKIKFEKHKMDNLHIKKEEVTLFKEYFVTNKLQEIIKKSQEKSQEKRTDKKAS
ncbi:MAG: hypothetical protein V4596_01985 [Bdellovibrionota bacterium]